MASRPCPEWSKPAIYQGGCGWSGLCIRPGFAQGVSLHPRSLSDHVSWPSLDPPTDRWLWHCQLHFFRPTCTVLITGPCRLRENGGQLSQALGHSRGGFSTKVHVRVDGLGNPLRFRLTGGQEHDVTQAEELIDGLDSEYVIADRAYDSNQFLESIIRSGAVPIIPRSLQAEGAPLIRRVSIPRASSGRMLHRQDQAFPPHLLPVRQAGEQIPRVPTFRRCSIWLR